MLLEVSQLWTANMLSLVHVLSGRWSCQLPAILMCPDSVSCFLPRELTQPGEAVYRLTCGNGVLDHYVQMRPFRFTLVVAMPRIRATNTGYIYKDATHMESIRSLSIGHLYKTFRTFREVYTWTALKEPLQEPWPSWYLYLLAPCQSPATKLLL